MRALENDVKCCESGIVKGTLFLLARAQKLKAKCSERVKRDLDAYGIRVDKFNRISPKVDQSIEAD